MPPPAPHSEERAQPVSRSMRDLAILRDAMLRIAHQDADFGNANAPAAPGGLGVADHSTPEGAGRPPSAGGRRSLSGRESSIPIRPLKVGRPGERREPFAFFTRSLRLASGAPPEDSHLLSSASDPRTSSRDGLTWAAAPPAHHAGERGLRSPCSRLDERRPPSEFPKEFCS